MPKIGFEAPGSVRDVLALLNRTRNWQLTYVDGIGAVHGHYENDFGRVRELAAGAVIVYNGEVDGDGQVMMVATTDEEAIIFLYGCYLGTFGNRSLEAVQDDLARHGTDRFA